MVDGLLLFCFVFYGPCSKHGSQDQETTILGVHETHLSSTNQATALETTRCRWMQRGQENAIGGRVETQRQTKGLEILYSVIHRHSLVVTIMCIELLSPLNWAQG